MKKTYHKDIWVKNYIKWNNFEALYRYLIRYYSDQKKLWLPDYIIYNLEKKK